MSKCYAVMPNVLDAMYKGYAFIRMHILIRAMHTCNVRVVFVFVFVFEFVFVFVFVFVSDIPTQLELSKC